MKTNIAPHRVNLEPVVKAPKKLDAIIKAPANGGAAKQVLTVNKAAPISNSQSRNLNPFDLLRNGIKSIKSIRGAQQMATPAMKSTSRGPRPS